MSLISSVAGNVATLFVKYTWYSFVNVFCDAKLALPITFNLKETRFKT